MLFLVGNRINTVPLFLVTMCTANVFFCSRLVIGHLNLSLAWNRGGWGIVAQGQCGSKFSFKICISSTMCIENFVMALICSPAPPLSTVSKKCCCMNCCSCSSSCSTQVDNEKKWPVLRTFELHPELPPKWLFFGLKCKLRHSTT